MWSSTSSTHVYTYFLLCPDASLLHETQDNFTESDMQSRALVPVPGDHSELSADERVERKCFGFGPSRFESTGKLRCFLSTGHNGFSLPMKHYSQWSAGSPDTWETFPVHLPTLTPHLLSALKTEQSSRAQMVWNRDWGWCTVPLNRFSSASEEMMNHPLIFTPQNDRSPSGYHGNIHTTRTQKLAPLHFHLLHPWLLPHVSRRVCALLPRRLRRAEEGNTGTQWPQEQHERLHKQPHTIMNLCTNCVSPRAWHLTTVWIRPTKSYAQLKIFIKTRKKKIFIKKISQF